MRKEKKKAIISKRNILLSLVALVLVMLTVVSATYSWIEEVSNVEIKTGEGQETPLHIGDKERKSDVKIDTNYTIGDTSYQRQNITYSSIDLGSYFYESGDMHLSGCYSDGDNFYFPVNKTSGKTDSNLKFRQGTKDDANVNYLSVTFNVSSPSSDTVYWFNNDNFLKAYTVNGDTTSENNGAKSLLRCSITVDNNTNVYSASNNGKYKKVSSTSTSAVSTQGRKISAYKWNASGTASGSATNKDADGKVNGNTLFTVEKGATKTVTFKLWLEYSSSYASISLSQLDLRLDSSWAHTRKITLRNGCIYNKTNNEDWLTKNASVYLMKKGTTSSDWNDNTYSYISSDSTYKNENHWQYSNFSQNGTIDDGVPLYIKTVEIPAAYNNQPVYFFRTNGYPTNNNSDKTELESGKGIYGWDRWETTLPNTFQDETYTIYTPNFGTWGTASHTYFVDSQNWAGSNNDSCWAYLWDNSTVMEDNSTKVIENHTWEYGQNDSGNDLVSEDGNSYHGEAMYYTKMDSPGGKKIFVVYWNSDTTEYSHIIFNNNSKGSNSNRQTSDIALQVNKYYDLNSDQWYDSINKIPDKGEAKILIHWNPYGTTTWNDDKMYYGESPADTYRVYKVLYLDGNKTYDFKIKDWGSGSDQWYGATSTNNEYNNSNVDWNLNGSENVNLKTKKKGFYIFTWHMTEHKINIKFMRTIKPRDNNTWYY